MSELITWGNALALVKAGALGEFAKVMAELREKGRREWEALPFDDLSPITVDIGKPFKVTLIPQVAELKKYPNPKGIDFPTWCERFAKEVRAGTRFMGIMSQIRLIGPEGTELLPVHYEFVV